LAEHIKSLDKEEDDQSNLEEGNDTYKKSAGGDDVDMISVGLTSEGETRTPQHRHEQSKSPGKKLNQI
jgi:hypothetical protein